MVRFANEFLEALRAYKTIKDSILNFKTYAAYSVYQYSRILIFSPQKNIQFERPSRSYQLSNYIISSLPRAVRSTAWTRSAKPKLQTQCRASSYGLESLTGDPSKRPRTGYDAEIGCFRKSVLIFLQLPPHIHTVHQSMDATQTELIAQSVFTSNRLSWSSSNTPTRYGHIPHALFS